MSLESEPFGQSGLAGVLWFSGFVTKESLALRLSQLQGYLEQDPDWEAISGVEPVVMQYNDPFTPPWKRRNEVAIPVRPRGSADKSADESSEQKSSQEGEAKDAASKAEEAVGTSETLQGLLMNKIRVPRSFL